MKALSASGGSTVILVPQGACLLFGAIEEAVFECHPAALQAALAPLSAGSDEVAADAAPHLPRAPGAEVRQEPDMCA